MTREAMLEVVDRWQQAIERHDLEALTDLYAPDAEVESPLGGTAVGHEAIIRVFAAFLDAFPDATFDYQPPIIDGDRVAATAIISGTNRGPLMGLPPSGRPFQFNIVCLFELEGGRIKRERRVYDFTGLLIQLGTLKAKPA